MLRLIILFFIFITYLHGLSSSEILKRADGFMKSGTKSDQFRAYNDYKNVYLRAIIDEDSKLRVRSLHGIVSTGDKLHIDITQYSKELKRTEKPRRKHEAHHETNT